MPVADQLWSRRNESDGNRLFMALANWVRCGLVAVPAAGVTLVIWEEFAAFVGVFVHRPLARFRPQVPVCELSAKWAEV